MLKKLCVCFVYAYQYCVRPYLPHSCRFYPTCSAYALIVLKTEKIPRAIGLIGFRLLRCHPFCPGGVDLPPKS